jgi:hypothetical protein
MAAWQAQNRDGVPGGVYRKKKLTFSLSHRHTDDVGRHGPSDHREHSPMRYVWASVVAFLIIFAGVLFVRQTGRFVERKAFESGATNGRPSSEIPISERREIGIEMPSSEIARVQAADILADYWLVFAILVIVGCLGVAAIAGRRTKAATRALNPTKE